MDALIQEKDLGIQKMMKKNYKGALPKFVHVVESLTPKTDEEFNLKMVCLIDICICHLSTYENQKLEDGIRTQALTDAFNSINESIKVYKLARPDSIRNTIAEEEFRKDQLNPVISLTYVYKGKCQAKKSLYSDAFKSFETAIGFYPEGEGYEAFNKLLFQLGYYPFDGKDDNDFSIYSTLLNDFLSPEKISQDLDSFQSIIESPLSPSYIDKMNKTHAIHILIPLHFIYLDDKSILLKILKSEYTAIHSGIITLWNCYNPLLTTIIKFHEDSSILSSALRVFENPVPDPVLDFMNSHDCFRMFPRLLLLPLSPETSDTLCSLLSQLSNLLIAKREQKSPLLGVEDEDQLSAIATPEFIDRLITLGHSGAIALLSHCTFYPPIIPYLESHRIDSFFVEQLKRQNISEIDMHASITGLISIASYWPPLDFSPSNEEPPKKMSREEKALDEMKRKRERQLLAMDRSDEAIERRHKLAEEIAPLIAGILAQSRKDGESVGLAYSLLSILVEWCGNALDGTRIVAVSSIMLSIHIEEEMVVNYVLLFLYEYGKRHVDELRSVKPLIPTVRKVMKKYQKPYVVEKAVALALLTDQPDGVQLLREGLQKAPSSPVLLEFAKKIGFTALTGK